MTRDTDNKILKKLKAMEKEEGKLPLLLQFFRDILRIQTSVRKKIGTPQVSLSVADIRNRMRRRAPILSLKDLDIHLESLKETFVRVADAFARYPDLFGGIPERLRKPEAGRLLTRKAVRAWFSGEALPPTLSTGNGDTVTRAVIQSTLKPVLSAYAEILIKSVDQEQWRQRYCPVCGGIPDMAFLETERGARYLLCSRCDSAWLYQRLRCPYCGTQDPDSLAFFADEKGVYQLNVCDKCRCYLKTIDLRKAGDDVLMPLERLLTTEMDRQARERGYRLPV